MRGIDLLLAEADRVSDANRRDIQFQRRGGRLDLTWGHPDPTLLPVDDLRAAADRVLAEEGWKALSYGSSQGAGRLRLALSAHLGQTGLEVDPDELVIVGGSSGGLDLVLTLLGQPGDVVIVEQPTYFLALKSFRDHHLNIVGLGEHPDGHDPDELAERTRTIRSSLPSSARIFLYLIPTFSNPTGRTLSLEQRRHVIDVAASFDLTVIEDDVYSELGSAAPPSVWSLDPTHVIRLGSFSKTLAPGLRLGFTCSSAAFSRVMTECGLLDSGGGTNPLAGMLVADLIESGRYSNLLEGLRSVYTERMKALTYSIDAALRPIEPPGGGYFTCFRVPDTIPVADFVARAAEHDIVVAPSSAFYVEGTVSNQLRLSCSLLDCDLLTQAGHRLSELAFAEGWDRA